MADLEAGRGAADPAEGAPLPEPRLYFAEVGDHSAVMDRSTDGAVPNPLVGQPIRSPPPMSGSCSSANNMVWLPKGPGAGTTGSGALNLMRRISNSLPGVGNSGSGRSSLRRSSNGNSSNGSVMGSNMGSGGASTSDSMPTGDRTISQDSRVTGDDASAGDAPGPCSAPTQSPQLDNHSSRAIAAELAAAQGTIAASSTPAAEGAASGDDSQAGASGTRRSTASSGHGSGGRRSERSAATNQLQRVHRSGERLAGRSARCLSSQQRAGDSDGAAPEAAQHRIVVAAVDQTVVVGRPLAESSQDPTTVTVVGWPCLVGHALTGPACGAAAAAAIEP